jgi:hypothetical protein
MKRDNHHYVTLDPGACPGLDQGFTGVTISTVLSLAVIPAPIFIGVNSSRNPVLSIVQEGLAQIFGVQCLLGRGRESSFLRHCD